MLHALELKGIDGHYGDQRKVVIMCFGTVSRGAIYELQYLDRAVAIQLGLLTVF